MAIAASYQIYGGAYHEPVLQVAADLKDMQNMMPDCGDYYVMHSWPADGAERCIVVYRWGAGLYVRFYAADLGGYLTGYDFPLDHEIWIGLRPNNAIGSSEYNSFTWWAWDKTADEYVEETRDTPGTWSGESIDVALEMVVENTPNGKKRGACNLYCLDKNQEEVKLSECFGWLQWDQPPIINHHEEIYTENGYRAECIQWKTIEGPDEMVLNINSDPQGQEVLIDGESVGLTPLSETVTCQEHDIMVQPQGVTEYPDLVIEDVWNIGNVIKYRIKNIGDCAAGASHTKLKVDGVETEVTTEEGLNAGQSREGAFAHFWECSDTEDTIEVVADCNGEVSEGNEGNNSLQKTIQCASGCIGIDLTPTDIFNRYGNVYFKVKNQGTQSSITCYHYIYFWTGSTWQYQGRKRAGAQAPDTTNTLSSAFSWPIAGTKIKVRVNGSQSFTDCNPANDSMEVTA